MKNLIFILLLLLLTGCYEAQGNQELQTLPKATIAIEQAIPIIPSITATPEVINENETLEGEPDILPIFDFRGIGIVGPFSEADLLEIVALMQTVTSEPITYIGTPLLIEVQYYKGEILEVPNNIAEVFYGTVQGDVYTVEKIEGAWKITGDDYWIK